MFNVFYSAVGSKNKAKVGSCNGGSNGMAFRRDSYKMIQRTGNNGIHKVEPMTSYSDIKANLRGQHFVSGLDNDIPGLPLICDYTTAHEYSNALDSELAMSRNTYCNENRIHWTNEKEVMTSTPLEQNQHQFVGSSFQYSSEVQKAIESILQIADHIRKDDDENNVRQLTSFFVFFFPLLCFYIAFQSINVWKCLQSFLSFGLGIIFLSIVCYSVSYYRLSKIGNTWLWFWIVYSFGYLL